MIILLVIVSLVAGFSFQHFEYIVPLLLAYKVSTENHLIVLWGGVRLYATSCFSLTAFKILSLSFTFFILIMICLAVDRSCHSSRGARNSNLFYMRKHRNFKLLTTN